jgi:hypothetical protein
LVTNATGMPSARREAVLEALVVEAPALVLDEQPG